MSPYDKKTITLLNKAELIKEMNIRRLALPEVCTKEAMLQSLRKYHKQKNTKFRTLAGKTPGSIKRISNPAKISNLLKKAAAIFPNQSTPDRPPPKEI